MKCSFEEFMKLAIKAKKYGDLPEFCNSKNLFLNGCGSIMRIAPVPIAFAKNPSNISQAMEFAKKQSKVTHTGEEAADCCALLTFLIIKNISRESINTDIKDWLDFILKDFNETENYSIKCLRDSVIEDKNEFNERLKSGDYSKNLNKNENDRNWDWKDVNFKYSPTREKMTPSYIGSYCMDGLAMALHICYHYNNPKDAILKACNMGGDCDTVAAIVGQIVGSFYGLDSEIVEQYGHIIKYDKYKCAWIAYYLYENY